MRKRNSMMRTTRRMARMTTREMRLGTMVRGAKKSSK
jgi:hypothetical protein